MVAGGGALYNLLTPFTTVKAETYMVPKPAGALGSLYVYDRKYKRDVVF